MVAKRGRVPDVSVAMWVADQVAEQLYDGHMTIMRFTTGWKCVFGTPDLGNVEERETVWRLPTFRSMSEAVVDAINRTPGHLKITRPIVEASRDWRP